ncbi:MULTISPECIES: hypothetical protein [Pseudomonas]|uniref:Uncharacterized protein n=1 Tax=Pseudomonas gregormendelii TaxID=1628277 RepID=A0ABS3AMY9_9PSED|nr:MULTISPECIES: hypothetical protein [Pseudomonas]MBN3968525.1 hypothetical protein [Pseudomonas gregormendelii]MDI3358153.1 hypothetical protein [Pseudomonas sp. UYIF39]
MSRIPKKTSGIKKTAKLSNIKYPDTCKKSTSSLGTELDLIILLAELPENLLILADSEGNP